MIIKSIFDLNNDILNIIEEYLVYCNIIMNYKKNKFNNVINELSKHLLSLDMYFNKLQLHKCIFNKSNKYNYYWLGKRNTENIFSLKILNYFNNDNNIHILNPFKYSKYICSCFKRNCSNSNISLDEYLHNKKKICDKNGKILLCLLMNNKRKNYYNTSHILNEIKFNKYSKLLEKKHIFEKKKKL